MATLTEIKNQFAQNAVSKPKEKSPSALLTENQRQTAMVRYAYEQEQKEKNQGGFWGGIGYAFEKLGLGFLQSIEGIWDFTAGGLADLFGADDWAEKQIANDWVNYNHADEWFNPSDGWKVVGDVTGGIGTSLPAIATVAAAAAIAYFSGGTLTPVAAGLIGGAVAGLGAAGTATKEAYKETGQLTSKEWGYGTLSGFTEGAMEGVSDAIGFGVGSIVKNLAGSTAKEGAKQVGKQIAKSAARQTFGKTVLKSFLSEAFEEGVQELIDPVWKRITYDPDAESATFQQVAYAALVGGLSGAIMGGVDVSVRNSINYFSGSKTTANGGVQGVIDLATTIAETEGVNQSGNAQVDFVVNTLSELQESLKTTNGEVKTAKQKMLVGILSKANTAAPLSIVVHQNADAIIADAETTVKRLNDIGYKTSKGEAVTVEMLKQGVTGERGTTEYRRSLSQAMKTNEALRSVAVMSAAGQLNMDAARFQQSTLRGEQLFNQSDLNHFVETATEQQKRDVGERLGIADWATVTADELKSRIVEFSTNGGLDQYINERNEVKKLTELEISKKGLPKYVGSIKQDGAVRYKFGDASVAIVKNGDTYLVYDYANDIASKPLTKTEANRVIKEIYAASVQSATDSDVQTKAQQETQQLDAFARENVPDYKNLVGAQQQAVRQTLRQARAAGVSEADQILYASVAARSGASIEFVSAEDMGANADAGYRMSDGKILVNREIANNPNARTAAKILLHEFTHAMIGKGSVVKIKGKGEKQRIKIKNKAFNYFYHIAMQGLTLEQKVEIVTPYIERHKITAENFFNITIQDILDGKAGINLETYNEIRTEIAEELAAHFVERELGNSAALKRIISDKPSFKDKLLSFLKRSKSDYSSNEKLSRAANALLKKYQAFFNKYATQNRFSPTITGDTSAYQITEAADAQTRLSIKKIDGRDVVVVDTDQHIFEGVTDAKALRRIAREYILNNFRNDVYKTTDGKGVIFTRKGAKKITNTEYLSKIRISTELNNFIKIAEYVKTVANVKNVNPEFSYFDYYRASFMLDGKMFDCLINVGVNTQTGTGVFYEITQIKEAPHNSFDGNNPVAPASNGTSTDIISNNEENVNPDGKKSNKKRYALTVDGENISVEVKETKNLVALHNLSEASLLKVLRLGGFPMPSIAVTRADMGHSEFGDITVVFGRETINPQRDRRNKVYSRDGWTPTVPKVEYKPNERVLTGIKKKHHELSGKVGYDAARVLYNYANDIERQLELYGGEAGIIADLYNNTDLMNLFLVDTSSEFIKPIYKTVRSELTAGEVAYRKRIIDALGKDFLAEFDKISGDLNGRKAFINEHKEQIVNALATIMQGKESIEETRENISKNFSVFALGNTLNKATLFLKDGGVSVSKEFDSTATQEAIRKATSKQEYIAWVDKLFGGIEEKTGIYNGRDPYTNSGNRRSFEALHYEYTLENMVNAMLDAPENGGSGWHGLTLGQLQAKLSKEFKSIDEIRLNADNLTVRDEAAHEEFSETTRKMLSEITALMVDESKYGGDDVAYWTALDSAEMVVGEIADNRLFTLEKIAAYMKREYSTSYRYNDSIGNKILGLFEYVRRENSTDYFEAKPRRAVAFSEIKKVLIPETASEKLIKQLTARNIPYQVYDSSDNARTNAIKQMDDVRFALPETDSQGHTLTAEQRAFFKNSKFIDDGGHLLTLYHQTSSEFTVFNTSIKGAGQHDYQTPFGIFMKPSSKNIGIKGNIQMALYANVTNPIEFADRTALETYLRETAGYGKEIDGILNLDTEYKAKSDAAEKRYTELATKAYENPENKILQGQLSIAEREWSDIIDEWGKAYDKRSAALKELVNKHFRSTQYDGIILRKDGGSFGRTTAAYIAFEPNQVKSVSNQQPTGSADIRFALSPAEYQQRVIAAQDMQKEARGYRKRLKINSDGSVTVYHGTSAENAQKIRSTGVINSQSYFATNAAEAYYYAHTKNKGGVILEIHADARSLEFAAAGAEIYAPSELRNIDGVYTSDNIRYALDMSKRQNKTSAATSINSAKLPVLYGKVEFKSGTVNLDIGGGRFDNVTNYLATKGVKNYIYDPYNRSVEHNAAVAQATQEGQSDTVTISNVLNVIDSLDGRRQVLENAVDAVKPDGIVYISVYEGDGSGNARTTGKDQFQLNRKTADYTSEVQEYFDEVTIKNKVIIAKSPKKTATSTRYALSKIEQEAISTFGQTNSWAETGYILTDGTRLDFSGKNDGASGGYRTIDHREISSISKYSDMSGTEAMIAFMQRGNIRIISEWSGINLSVLPTKAQESILIDFISRKKGEIILDIDNADGDTVVSVEYPKGTSSVKIIQDIRNYFNDGTQPVVSEISKFRYALSETDSMGKKLSEQQRRFFNESKAVDKNGNLLVMYHGTFNDFTVFDIKKTSSINKYGQGHYFTSSITDAETHYMEAGKNPDSHNDVDTKIEEMAFDLFAERGYSYEDSLTNDSDILSILNECYDKAEKYYSRANAKLMSVYLNIKNPLYVRKGKEVGSVYDYVLVDTTGKIVNIETSEAANYGYDGIIDTTVSESLHGVDKGTVHIVAFKPEQIKLTSNQSPTANSDIRYAISESQQEINPTESDNSGAIGGLTRGQRAKFVANNTKFKVYSKLDATSVIDSIIAERLTLRDGQYEGVLSGKNRAEVIEKLFTKLNSTPEGYRIGVALDIADYIINNAVLSDMYETYNDDSYAMGVLSVMRRYMHGVNLSGIQSEIQYKFDRKNSINLVWGAKMGGQSPDVIAQELEGYGIHIEAINEAEQFFEMLELYERAREQVNQKAEKIMLTAIGSKTEIEQLRQEIARDVLLAYDKKGTPSKYAKLVEQYTKKIADLKKDLSTAYKRNTLTNRIIDGAAYLRDIANKRNYVGAEIFAAPELTQWLKQLSKIKYRSDLRKTGVRKILLDYGQFYTKDNSLLYDEKNPEFNYIDNNVIDALNFIRQNALSTKPLSMEELQAAEIIIASAKHLFNNYDQIIIEGKKAKISELATEGNEIIKKSKNRTNKTFFNKIYGAFNKIIEPRVVIKSLENFNPNGILTRAYAEVTRGETEAGLLYIELTNDIDTYIKKHKRFKNRLTSEYITVAGAELTVGQAISLYELSKRTQAQEGLYESGFSYIDKKGSKQTAHITEADITAMYDAFTDTDKGFIELVETFFNVACKQVKTDADMQILGYTNASDEFYYPIKRDSGTIAKNITDARSIMSDWANVYNFSFNKDVKTGAKNKLFITDVYSVVTRHAKQLATYAKMTVPIKNFSQIYAKNIGDKTNVVSIRNTINEQVWGGAEGYLSKLFSDIQGRATSNSIIEKMRGAYAKYQLGANLKVIVSQITSYPTAGIMLDSGVMAKGFVMKTNWAAMDKYCPYARVRNFERGIVRAEGVVDKIGKVGDVLTKPIQWTDRFTIGRLWNACQLQVQKDTGLKYGTVENMQKAGDMLEEVIRLTQPNYTNTERSELMRSDSDIVRSFTMFTSVPLKQLSRLVESFGEYNALRSLIKSGDSDPTLSKRYKLAKKKIRRTLAAVTIANLMYVLVGQFFKFLYNNMAEDDEEGKVTAKSFFLDMLKDFGSTTIGMLPVVRDIYGYFVNGYEIENFTGDMLNSIISSAKSLFELATKAASGEEIKTQEYMSIFRNSLYSIGQVTGIPVRNINNTITGLIKRFSPSTAYSYTSLFYNHKYSTDIKAALKKGDYDLAETIMGMMLKDDRTGGLNEKATKKLIELYDAGYSVLPKSIGNTLTYNGETVQLTAAQQSAFKTIYSQANAEIEKLVNSAEFATLPAERQAKAIKLLYDAYYSKAQASVLKLANENKIVILSGAIPPSTLAPHLSAISAIESDTDKAGNVINGSKKAKVIKYVMAQKLDTVQKLLLILSLGYTIKDGDIKGISALKAKRTVARYITNLSISKEEKIALAEKCGLTVKNGRIYAK